MKDGMKVRPDQKNIKLFSTAIALLKHVKTWQKKTWISFYTLYQPLKATSF
jgi:hypothetical protein